ncbi:MAG: VOC family protein [Chloroflexi bacterium]|nr:MAG: VOC family protein [Chloroflexota bacterium]
MKVLGLVWMGTRTDRFAETTAFFEKTMGLTLGLSYDGFREYTLPNADVIEVFAADSPHNTHVTRGPAVGFLVADIAKAEAELAEAGTELLGEVQHQGGYSWLYFRGPDGNVYEVVEDRRRIGAAGM